MTNNQLQRLRTVIDISNLWDKFIDISYWSSDSVVTEDDLMRGNAVLKSNKDFQQYSIYNNATVDTQRYCELESENGRRIMTKTINWRTVQYILAFFTTNSDLDMTKHYKHNGKICHCHEKKGLWRKYFKLCSQDGLPRTIPKLKLRQTFGDNRRKNASPRSRMAFSDDS